jgi:error-prone DNA polymerase
VRLGLSSVRSLGDELAQRIAEGRPYRDLEDVRRRSGAGLAALEAMATAGAFECLGLSRRQALWVAGAVVQSGDDRLAGIVTGDRPPTLPGMSEQDLALADLWATGVSPDGHPTRFHRPDLDGMGVVTAAGLKAIKGGVRVSVAGVVTHRQRPATAGGTTFINLEDETGLINVVVSKGCWAHHRRVARGAAALLIRGRLERGDGDVLNVIAERMQPLGQALGQALGTANRTEAGGLRSRDFR